MRATGPASASSFELECPMLIFSNALTVMGVAHSFRQNPIYAYGQAEMNRYHSPEPEIVA